MVEGPTLADRISKGPIPLDAALPISKQIAEALEAAHEAGVIHRDLKPANIKVREDGTVKVLDFGLAKALTGDAPRQDLSDSFTATTVGTGEGEVWGTAAYMSPEQARGQPLDKRTDIWAFGCVFYEMLTGRGAFRGATLSDTIAKVLERQPRWEGLPAGTAPVVRKLLRRCLEKDPRARLRDVGDARLEIAEAIRTPGAETTNAVAVPRLRVWQRPVSVALIAVCTAAVACLAVWILLRPAQDPIGRFVISSSATERLFRAATMNDVAISPDGQSIAYLTVPRRPVETRVSSGGPGGRQLQIRAVDQLVPSPLELVSGNLYGPFFSPDGEWLGFYNLSDRTLRKVSVHGGPSLEICDLPVPGLRGASWGVDDRIIFATEATDTGLWSVSAGGGEPEQLTTPDERGDHHWPEILPGGEAVLFTIMPTRTVENGQLAVLLLADRDVKMLNLGGSHPRYIPTGHLVFGVGDDTLSAVRFDLGRLEVTSDPIPVMDGVITKRMGAVSFSVAQNGSLVYMSGEATPGRSVPQANRSFATGRAPERTLVWVDREGREEPLGLPPAAYDWARVSPDETRVAVEITGRDTDVSVSALARPTLSRVTTDPGFDGRPVWTLDSERLVFASDREGALGLFSKAADGSGAVVPLMTLDATADNLSPNDWSSDGNTLVFHYSPTMLNQLDIGVLSMDGAPTWDALITMFSEASPTLSPDGSWIAYHSNGGTPGGVATESEVYVERFPELVDKQPISTGGGTDPMWSPDQGELFYRDLAARGRRGSS